MGSCPDVRNVQQTRLGAEGSTPQSAPTAALIGETDVAGAPSGAIVTCRLAMRTSGLTAAIPAGDEPDALESWCVADGRVPGGGVAPGR